MRADRERVEALQRDLREVQQAQMARDAQAQVPLNAMQRDADASRGLLQAVLERIQQTAQQPAIEAPDAHEISLALIPAGRASRAPGRGWRRRRRSGSCSGCCWSMCANSPTARFRSGDDVRTVLGLPCLALIPRISRRALKGS